MQTINLKVEDSFYPHFQAILESFIKDKKVIVLDRYDNLDFSENSSSVVREKALVAEKRIKEGKYVSEDDYRSDMNNFLENL